MDEPAVIVTSHRPPASTVLDGPSPFRRLDSDEPARVVLRQVTATDFQLMEGFRYEGRRGSWNVLPEHLPDTDLASIPRLLGWFASSYGRHTLAALLHDHLCRNGDDLDPPVPRYLADDVFRDALGESGVPYLRTRIMWSAVVLATRWKDPLQRIAMAVWIIAALAGITLLIWGAADGRPAVVAAAALAPVPFAMLWGPREYVAGVVGGYTLWFMTLPTLVNMTAYGIYMAAEQSLRGLRLLPRGRRDTPRPAGPPTYQER